MKPTARSHYQEQLEPLEGFALQAVDALLLDQLRTQLPQGTKLDANAAGALAAGMTALLNLPKPGASNGFTVRIVNSDPLPDAARLMANVTPDTLLLVGPVGKLAESPALRALVLAADAADLTVTPLQALHPAAHDAQLAAVTAPGGPAAGVLAALTQALTKEYDLITMARENVRLEVTLQGMPSAKQADNIYKQLQQITNTDVREGLAADIRDLYHKTFTLETRLALRELRWRLFGRKS
jgi:hypothetical protein